MTRRLVNVHCLLLLTRKRCLDDYFSGAFNTSSLNQTGQTIHHHDELTLYFTPEWISPANYPYSRHSVASNWSI
jgi:hypothetical protein